MRLLPGDPLSLYITRNDLEIASPEAYQALLVEFGMDKPLPQQYFNWIFNVFHGDFGVSMIYKAKVSALIAERFPVTAHLAILALIASGILGITAGVLCAVRRGGRLDAAVTSVANFGISVPIFWLGILMVYLFGLYLKWLPTMGYTSPFDDFWLSTKRLIMPVICLAITALASVTRQTRSSILEVIQQDYVRTAWSKGLRERVVVFRHILKNGLIPVVTLTGMQVSHIFGGSVLIETVFNIPGMGRLMVNSVFAQDYPVVQGCTILFALIVVIVNLFVDISYGWLDPRIRYG
jgi:peptide/nickel transport system permease protein